VHDQGELAGVIESLGKIEHVVGIDFFFYHASLTGEGESIKIF
jgi:hypothetical protein